MWHVGAEPAGFEAIQGDSGAVPCSYKNTTPAEMTENILLCFCAQDHNLLTGVTPC